MAEVVAVKATQSGTPEAGGAAPARREAALHAIPEKHSLGLRLREAGLDDERIAQCLDIEPEAVPTFLVIAEGKLAAQLAEGQ